jgi:hypothetical protein
MRTNSNKLLLLLSFVFFFLYSAVVQVFATAQYGPGNVDLDPTCAYTDITCTVGQMEFLNEGVSLTNEPISVDFVGPGVTATELNGALTVTISGSGGAMAIDDGVVGGTEGSVLFVDSFGNLQEDPTNFYWDDGSDFLGIGTNTPGFALDVAGVINTGTQFDVAGEFFATQDTTNGYLRIGRDAGNGAMSGGNNILIGKSAGNTLTSGYMNLFIGNQAGGLVDTGTTNVFIGNLAGSNTTSGDSNVSIGVQSGESNVTGDENTFLGYYAGNFSSGSDNTFLGYRTGDVMMSGSHNILIGHDIDVPISAGNNQLSIGNLIYGTGIDGVGTTLSTGNVGVGTNSPDYKFEVEGDVNLYDEFITTGLLNGVSVIRQGDLSALEPGADHGLILFVGDSLVPSQMAYQKLDFNEGDPVFYIKVDNNSSEAEMSLNSSDGSILLNSDPSGAMDSYFNLNADGSVDLSSTISTNINSGFTFDADGEVNLYSNTDIGVSSGITLSGTGALNPGSINMYTVNASDIQSTLILDPDALTILGVDDENGELSGSYSMTMRPNYIEGIVLSHTDASLDLVDVGTFYLGSLDAGSGSISSRVVTSAVSNSDFIYNESRITTGGLNFTYQSGDPSMSTLNLSTNLVWDGDSTSFTSTIPASNTNDGDLPANLFTTTITSTADVTDEASYKGISSIIDYVGDNDLSAGISATEEAPIIGMYSSATNNSLTGNVAGVIGGDFRAFQSGAGIATNVRGLSILAGTLEGDITDLNGVNVSIGSFGPGSITESRALSFSANNLSSGNVTDGYGIVGQVTNSSPTGGAISNAYAANLAIKADPNAFGSTSSTITSATGLLLKVFSPEATIDDPVSGTISTVVGIDMSAGLYGSTTEAGLESSGSTTGISFTSSLGRGSLEGSDVYGIYFNDNDSLQGSGDEYALYIGDTDAENWFANGVRIGLDSNDSKIDNATNGGSSEVLYIGTNTIDTTAPSDERTKENIDDTVYGLDDLNQIRVVDFTYNQSIIDDDNQQHTGVLAQQIASLYPEAVSTRSDGYFMVDYKKFTPLIIKSIQDMDLKINNIQNFTDETFVSKLQEWLGSVTNGLEKLYAGKVETYEIQTEKLCVGSRCITEEQFTQLLDENNISSDDDNVPSENPPQDLPSTDNPPEPSDDDGSGDLETPPPDTIEEDDTDDVVTPPSDENTPPDDIGDNITPPEDQNSPEEII